jgi:transketolase
VRDAFVAKLCELASHDPGILLLTGDLGFNVLEPFAEQFPGRFFNVGVAEQNMVGMATGLAECGFRPFVYSIATFAALRGYEFVRNGPVAHHLPVRLVGVGGGFDYGPAGPTHHALEDIGVMRLQPTLTVLAPADAEQTRAMVAETWDLAGPIYYRIGKDANAPVPGLDGRFRLGRSEVVREGSDVLLLTMGSLATEAVAAAKVLERRDSISCRVAVVSTLSPPPVTDLVAHLAEFSFAVTAESHFRTGGLGTLVAEIIAETGLSCRLVRCGAREHSWGLSGSQTFLNERNGLDPDGIAGAVRDLRRP